jgi:hypothetical protein
MYKVVAKYLGCLYCGTPRCVLAEDTSQKVLKAIHALDTKLVEYVEEQKPKAKKEKAKEGE